MELLECAQYFKYTELEEHLVIVLCSPKFIGRSGITTEEQISNFLLLPKAVHLQEHDKLEHEPF